MERGPMALFGAIVAVGLGPAMWLGAQFGESTLTPSRPPAVTVQQNSSAEPRGGSGAGDAPADQTEVIRTEPKAKTETIRTRPKAEPPTTSPAPAPSTSDEPATEPTESTPPADDGSQEPSTPPAEEPSEPETPPTEESTEPPAPPEPPATDLDTEQLAGDSRA